MRLTFNTIKIFLYKRTIAIYWFVLFLASVFLYLDYPFCIAVTESLLVPLLLLYVLMRDNNIGQPAGKFIFFIGLILAFFGDVLQVVINNETFFLGSLVVFMLMNICYGISFYSLNKPGWYFFLICILLSFAGYLFFDFLGEEMGSYQLPVTVYAFTLCAMIALASNVMASKKYRKLAMTYLLPGSVIFLFQNMILAANLFHLGGHNSGYVFSVIPYGIAQYLMVKGTVKAYGNR